MKPQQSAASLDRWRDYFRRGDSDIFEIIDHAIMVAATDCPIKFKSRRDRIAELLFSCRVTRCTGCHHHSELSLPGEDEAVDGSKESKANSSRGENNHINQIVGSYSYDDEAEALSDAIEEFSMVCKEVARIKEILLNKDDEPHSVILESLRKLKLMSLDVDVLKAFSDAIEEFSMVCKEVVRIKEILLNKDDEPHSVILEALRKLKLMSLDVDVLKSTEIGKAVNGLRKHGSDKIRQLAKTLIAEWKELVDQWVNTTKEIAGAEGTPESANPSVVDEEEEEEEEVFPSLPYGVDIFTPEANRFEMLNGDFFDSLDFDGNPCNSGEYNTSREDQRRPQKRRPEGTQMRIQKPSPADGTRRPLNQRMKNEVGSVHKSESPMIQRRKPPQEVSCQKLKGLDADAKFEFAKRKLQESYQQHDKAKKQRTIQVLETIPKQGSAAQKPQLKRPGMNNISWSNGRK